MDKALQLAEKGKYKRALSLVRKQNQKQSQITFQSLELEAVCLFHEKNYKLALIKAKESFKLAATQEHKLNALQNIAILYEKLDETDKVLSTLEEFVELDTDSEYIENKTKLVEIADKQGLYDLVNKYAPDLVKYEEYTFTSLIALIRSAQARDDDQKALQYLNKLDIEIRAAEGVRKNQTTHLRIEDMGFALFAYADLKQFKLAEKLLAFLEDKYSNTPWLIEAKTKIASMAKKKSKKEVSKAEVIPSSESIESNQTVIGDDVNVVNIIEKLIKQLTKKGATFHPAMQIRINKGNISVYASRKIEEIGKLMRVPLNCMPIISDYRFSLNEDSKLKAELKKAPVNPGAAEILHTCIEMFNATNKLAMWKQSYPIFQLAGYPNLANALLSAKSHSSKYAKLYNDSTDDISENAIINSFLGSRVFSFRKHHLRKQGIKIKREREEGIIPLIELINHKMGAPAYEINEEGPLLEVPTRSASTNEELFVQYNLDDPVVTFLQYGFVDTYAPWLYSVPLKIESLTGLVLEVNNLIGSKSITDLDVRLHHLAQYIPEQYARVGNVIHLGSLIITHEQDAGQLPEVLRYILTSHDLEGHYLDEDLLLRDIQHIQRQVIDLNINFWNGIKSKLEEAIQKDKLNNAILIDNIELLYKTCLSYCLKFRESNVTLLKAK